MHPLDDVVALAEVAQRRFCLLGDDPLTGADGLGKAEVFEVAQASDLCVRYASGCRSGDGATSMTPCSLASRTSWRSSWVQRSAST